MEHGTGALKSPYDLRDYWYKPAGRGVLDWDYDIEKVIGQPIASKNQGKSGSCGGQAWAYYGAVLERIATLSYEERSAKWIYSHTHVPPGGGSNGRTNCDFVIKTGWAKEKLVSSYEEEKPPSEAYMTSYVPVTKDIIEDTEVTKALSYLRVDTNFNKVAQAIVDNYGCILTVRGKDNGTWLSKFPQPPIGDYEWRHFLYAGKLDEINGKKYIGVKNSWGDKTGENGWQWLGEEYFTSGNVDEAYTMTWNYTPALHKQILIKTVDLLKQVVSLYQKMLNK